MIIIIYLSLYLLKLLNFTENLSSIFWKKYYWKMTYFRGILTIIFYDSINCYGPCESGLYIPACVCVHSTHSTHTTTKKRLAIMLRTDPRWIPEEWLFRPHFTLWPPQLQRAVLWVLAQFLWFRSQLERNLTFQDYIEFLRRSKYKFYRKRNRITQVRNYLWILEIDQGWNPADEQKNIPNVATSRWMHPGHWGPRKLHRSNTANSTVPRRRRRRKKHQEEYSIVRKWQGASDATAPAAR